ncbi:MAG TPA: glycosyltransferase family 9 protein [Candidatus Eisenbacteria bacterium]|jgi:lipopolysaccharide heptosyltransferase I|nr:glycosyltransferase family 9 protein [Candidatus Eisenbacteria bacterium]
MAEPRFLVVRLSSLGDIVHAFPAVGGLRESFPHAEIVWLTHPKWEPLVRAANLANEVWTVDTRDWASLRGILYSIRKQSLDAAIDFQGLWKSASIPFLARVPRRIGFSSETVREAGVPLLYTERVRVNTALHVADQNGELSLRAGAKQRTAQVTIQITPEDSASVKDALRKQGISEYIVLSPGGGWQSKCWPAERFGKLALRILDELHLRCVINRGPGEEDLVAATIAAAERARPTAYGGNLGQLMALLKNASAVVAGDTGPLHLADALGAPIVAIFGPTDPARNGPYRHNGVVLRWEGAETTYKRGTETDASLLHISVDEVLGALRGLRESA